jgi:hypothetical protein
MYVSGDILHKKLTLSAESDVIAEAHRLAELHGTSVSAMGSRIVRLLSQRDRERRLTDLKTARRALTLIRDAFTPVACDGDRV